MIGQELDSTKGGFNTFQTLVGEVADWVLLNESLNVNEMKEYVACRGLPDSAHPILHLETSLTGWELKGPSLSYSLTANEVCNHGLLNSLVMFPRPVEQEEAIDFCHMLGGILPVPENRQDNNDLSLLSKEYESECQNTWSIASWLGIMGNLTVGTWQRISDPSLPIPWNNFHEAILNPTPYAPCVTIDVQDRIGAWVRSSCTVKTCAVCQFAKTPLLYLRGLCEESEFDRVFMIKGVRGTRPIYVGYFKSHIFMKMETWMLESTINGSKSFARMMDDFLTTPLGRHKWTIDSDECGHYEVRRLSNIKILCIEK